MSKVENPGRKSGHAGQGGQGRSHGRDCGDGWDGWGGYMNAKKQKLAEQYTRDRESTSPQIFRGISIYINGYTQPSSDELRRLMVQHGGQFEQYLYRRRVTHVIATNLPDSKIRKLNGLKVVHPEWITDSVREGRLLSYIPYQLYSSQTGTQRGLDSFARPKNQPWHQQPASTSLPPSIPVLELGAQPASDETDEFDTWLADEESFATCGALLTGKETCHTDSERNSPRARSTSAVDEQNPWGAASKEQSRILPVFPGPELFHSVQSSEERQHESEVKSTSISSRQLDSENAPSSISPFQLQDAGLYSQTPSLTHHHADQNPKELIKKKLPHVLSVDDDDNCDDSFDREEEEDYGFADHCDEMPKLLQENAARHPYTLLNTSKKQGSCPAEKMRNTARREGNLEPPVLVPSRKDAIHTFASGSSPHLRTTAGHRETPSPPVLDWPSEHGLPPHPAISHQSMGSTSREMDHPDPPPLDLLSETASPRPPSNPPELSRIPGSLLPLPVPDPPDLLLRPGSLAELPVSGPPILAPQGGQPGERPLQGGSQARRTLVPEMPQCLSPSPDLDNMPQLKAAVLEPATVQHEAMPDLRTEKEKMLQHLVRLSPPPLNEIPIVLLPNTPIKGRVVKVSPKKSPNFSPSRSRPLFGRSHAKQMPVLTPVSADKSGDVSCNAGQRETSEKEGVVDPVTACIRQSEESPNSFTAKNVPRQGLKDRGPTADAGDCNPPKLLRFDDCGSRVRAPSADLKDYDLTSTSVFMIKNRLSELSPSNSSTRQHLDSASTNVTDMEKSGNAGCTSVDPATDKLMEEFQNDSDDDLAEIELGSQLERQMEARPLRKSEGSTRCDPGSASLPAVSGEDKELARLGASVSQAASSLAFVRSVSDMPTSQCAVSGTGRLGESSRQTPAESSCDESPMIFHSKGVCDEADPLRGHSAVDGQHSCDDLRVREVGLKEANRGSSGLAGENSSLTFSEKHVVESAQISSLELSPLVATSKHPGVPPESSSGCAVEKSKIKSSRPFSSKDSTLSTHASSHKAAEHSSQVAASTRPTPSPASPSIITQSMQEDAVQPSKTTSQAKSIPRTGDPKFLSEYYSNSRLHHISTWGAEFRAYVKQLQQQASDFPGRAKLREIVAQQGEVTGHTLPKSPPLNSLQRVVMHIDMDCFFVSVSLLGFPHLKGKPVAVAHCQGRGSSGPRAGTDPAFEAAMWRQRRKKGPKRSRQTAESPQDFEGEDEDDGIVRPTDEIDFLVSSESGKETFRSMSEIASCSYEARKAGVKNGMFLGRARELCPELAVIPYDFEGYQRVSHVLYDTVGRYTHDIEAVSCDELLVDCTDLLADTGATPLQFATVLREEIFQQTECNASVGLGPSILVARMATRRAKPNGQFFVEPSAVSEFIRPQHIRDLPGVGWSTGRRLETMKVTTCAELQAFPLSTLQQEFGPKTGEALHRFCRGQDERAIRANRERKSVSAEVNYGIRFTKPQEADKFLMDLSEEVQRRLQQIHVKGKTVTLKLMIRRPDAPQETAKFMGHGICNNFSKSVTMPLATDDASIIAKECIGILKSQKFAVSDLRGIGIQMQRLESATLGPPVSSKGHQSILNFAVPTSKTASASAPSSTVSSAAASTAKETASIQNLNQKQQPKATASTSNAGTTRDYGRKRSFEETSSTSAKISGVSSVETSSSAATVSMSVSVSDSGCASIGHSKFAPSLAPSATSSLHMKPSGSGLSKRTSETTSLCQSPEFLDSAEEVSDEEWGERVKADHFHKVRGREPQKTGTEGGREGEGGMWGEGGREGEGGRCGEGGRGMTLRWDKEPEGPSTLVVTNSKLLSDLSRPQKARQELPPLPCLPSTPECEASRPSFPASKATVSTATVSMATASSSPPSQPSDSYADFLPSPSQVDPAVLAELPPDIRRQVEEDMQRQHSSRTLRRHRSDTPPSSQQSRPRKSSVTSHGMSSRSARDQSSPQPGCSTWDTESERPGAGAMETPAVETRREERVEALPSLSQLDPDCLSALPEDMQEELRAAYAAKERSRHAHLQPPTLPQVRQSGGQRSPSKGRSPKRAKRGSPQFKVPRGRPGRRRMHSPRKLQFQQQQQQQQSTINLLMQSSSSVDVERRRLDFDSAPVAVADSPPAAPSLSDSPVPPGDESGEENSVDLCGAVTIGDVRKLLSLWLESSADPQQEDVEVITRYLADLVLDQNLEQVDLVLKALHRYTRRSESALWVASFEKVLTDTQSLIFSLYGSRLHTPWLPNF